MCSQLLVDARVGRGNLLLFILGTRRGIVRFLRFIRVREVLRLEHEGACHPWDIAGYKHPFDV